MIENIIRFSVKNKLIVGLFVLALMGMGIYSMSKLPVDAVPDITNNQVQIVTSSPSLAPQEVEQLITYPVEKSVANIPGVEEIRSISRFGLSIVTVVFEEDIPIMRARQFVSEQLTIAQQQIPESLGTCEMMPITTGLGEIYQYTLEVDSAYRDHYDPMELRTIQDWIVKRQMAGIEGIIEISSFGGYTKQYEVSVNPLLLQTHGLTITDVYDALTVNNKNTGGSYIEKGKNAFYIRTEGLLETQKDIENIAVASKENGVPIFVRNIGSVTLGSPKRFGAMTMDGKGEVVGGITLMFKGANSSEAIQNVHDRVEQIQKSLPPGVKIAPYLDRSVLVGKAINTVSKNLIEGGLIVIFVLILLLGNWRAGLIVASVIPLSLLFAFILMHFFGVSANLMSLGAIDFGIVVDGAVIVVEGVLHLMYARYLGKRLSQKEMDDVIVGTSSSIIGSAAFGVLIIIVVFVPIMTLTGIEGKMFVPMAKTVSFAIFGALLLSITYVPMMAALILKKNIKEQHSFADRLMGKIQSWYKPLLSRMIRIPYTLIGVSLSLMIGAVLLFGSMGGEFIPTLDEGDLAMQATIKPGSSLTQMIATTTEAETVLKKNFPEVKHVVSKIGTAEVPTDPMAVEDADVMILLKDRSEWKTADSREELVTKMKEKLASIDHAQFDFTQPIQLRFNELISGAKTDVVIKLYGEDLEELSHKGEAIASIVKKVQGAGDVQIERTEGLPQLIVRFNREKMAYYNLSIDELNKVIGSAFAGINAGVIYEGERKFDLTVRLNEHFRENLELSELFVNTHAGLIPLNEVATVTTEDGPMLVSHEGGKRRIAVGVNIRNRDVSSFIDEVRKKLEANVSLAPGYYIEYGGQFENLEAAKDRLSIAVPISLILIFLLLFFAFKSMKYALMIYSTVPLAAIGGVLSLYFRGMPFSISGGVGFIALFGVAVLNGIVLISYFNKLREEGETDIKTVILTGASARLRPVIMTAMVASLGFLPMAISTSAGAEVQKPLATVVIGGLISATLLTLIILPIIYYLANRKKMKTKHAVVTVVMVLLMAPTLDAQVLTEQMAIDSMITNSYDIKNNALKADQYRSDAQTKFSLGNTDLSFNYGQINSALRDPYVQINQQISNPVYQLKQAKEAESHVRLTELEQTQIIATQTWWVRSAWHNWMLQNTIVDLLKEQVERIDTHIVRLEERQKVGDVSLVDLGMTEMYRSELITKLILAEQQQRQAESELKSLTQITGEIGSPQQEIRLIETLVATQAEDSTSVLLAVEQAKLDVSLSTLKKEKSSYFPDFSVGYINQSIDHVGGLQAFTIGLSLPLLNRNYQSAIRKARIQTEIQSNSMGKLENQLMNKIEELQSILNQKGKLLEENDEKWSAKIALLNNAAEAELNEGEIDYTKYVQARGATLNLSIQRLELINEYNQTTLELSYYLTTK